MMYDLIEVKPKLNKKKVVIACAITVIVVAFFVILGIELAKVHKGTENNTIAIEETNVSDIIKTKHIAQVSFNPQYTDTGIALMNNIYNQNEKTAYLTFDDGPSQSVTPLILDLLKQENIKATFFVLGYRAKANPELIKREYLEGHYIANHGYSHVYGNIYASTDAVLEEYIKTKELIKNILETDYDGHLFRFPGGSNGGKYHNLKADAKVLLAENGIAYVDWNALSNDAAGANTKEAIMQNLIETVGEKNSVVILMHDAGDKILTYETLPDVIAYLRERGYNFKNFYNVIK